ncbi:hypothetical protein FPY71_05725 [Aureimonas fodinaquatilis]|uniref:Cell division protein FtsL n=1 Tax=Aureimonas fodinaquatilis TaxID=2565783 RepID=A0A5B0E0I8_9HYPH|nr:hypothetical protein [Aureimonas fodinaquatilis]KAA0972577.1 hypothetical protein FPY71_05725 [Aureimonas fodinaquatilis]
MLRPLDIVLVAVMLGAATWTFSIKHEAEAVEEALRDVDRRIGLERDTISLLEADWSLLNQPYRLQRLANAFSSDLSLVPITPEQIVGPEELPSEPVPVMPEANDRNAGLIARNGSVVQ